jgi:N-acetylneuraminic acid mutarotase
MASRRNGHTASVLTNGKVLVAGGYDTNSSLNSAELYDLSTENWTYTRSMSNQRNGHTASVLINGRVLVAGGRDNVYLNSAELYSWT